jgi:hypothetical protein
MAVSNSGGLAGSGRTFAPRGSGSCHHIEKLRDAACRRLREPRIQLPAEPELQRLVNAALNGYFHDLYERVTAPMTAEVRSRMNELLVVPKEKALSRFELLKADAATAGIENMGNEIVHSAPGREEVRRELWAVIPARGALPTQA